MQEIVIGLGEVGQAIQKILNCDGFDNRSGGGGEATYDIIHICFPCIDQAEFVRMVNEYKERYAASLVVIHSTVPIGTSDMLDAVHSPVRGVHPNLEQGIRTFVKYFGGSNADRAALRFGVEGIRTKCVPSARTTEALKLWDTTQYGAMILLEKQIKLFCIEHELDFDTVYTDANRTYNAGYTELNMPHVVRPYLTHMDGPIGGHCVMPNVSLLRRTGSTPITEELINADYILRMNVHK